MRRNFLMLVIAAAVILSGAVITSFIPAGNSIHAAGGKKKEKKKDKKKKKKKKKKPVKSDCDPTSLKRTSSDSVILKKYVTLYRNLGGVCYIRQLQRMGKIEQTEEGKFTVFLGKSKDASDRMAWTTYMFCPIGKPDGSLALVDPAGDTIQYCTYKNEMKNGVMYWLKPRYGIVATQEFVNDEKPVKVVADYEGGLLEK